MGKFVIKETKTGVKFDLKAVNGEVIASSEVYTAEVNCRKGIASVMKNAPIAAVEDQTVEGFKKEKHPSSRSIPIRRASSASGSRPPTVRSSPTARAIRPWRAA